MMPSPARPLVILRVGLTVLNLKSVNLNQVPELLLGSQARGRVCLGSSRAGEMLARSTNLACMTLKTATSFRPSDLCFFGCRSTCKRYKMIAVVELFLSVMQPRHEALSTWSGSWAPLGAWGPTRLSLVEQPGRVHP